MLTTEERLFMERTKAANTVLESVDVVATEFLNYLSTVDSMKCRACGSQNIVYRLLQTRSADEGMSTFYVCRSCTVTWSS